MLDANAVQVINQTLIRFTYLESMFRQAIADVVGVIRTEVKAGPIYFQSPVVKLFCVTELAIQGLKIVIALNALLLQCQTNRAMAHSIRVLHRSLFDCLLRVAYINRLDSQADVGVVRKYLYSGVLDGFRKQCRVIEGIKDSLPNGPNTEALSACTEGVEELLNQFDAEWFFEEARQFNVHEDELKDKPVLHFVKDPLTFSKRPSEKFKQGRIV